MSCQSHMQELRGLCAALQKAADVPPPAPVTRQPPPPLSSLPDMRIGLAPLDQSALWTEYNMYRNKNQHRHAIYFHRLVEVKKVLAKWKTLDLRGMMTDFFSQFDRSDLCGCTLLTLYSMRVPMLAPSRHYTIFTLARLRVCRAIIGVLFLVTQRAYIAVRDVLSQRFFMAFTVLCMAMLSRFHSELTAADELLSLLTERLTAFMPYCDPSPPSNALSTLLQELEPMAAKAPPLRQAPRTLTVQVKRAVSAASTLTRTTPTPAAIDLGAPYKAATEPIKRAAETPDALKRPRDSPAVEANAAKKPKSPLPAPATPPAAARSGTTAQRVPATPGVGVTPPLVRAVQKTPTSASFWTPSPAPSPSPVSSANKAAPSPRASPVPSPSMQARPVGLAKPKPAVVPSPPAAPKNVNPKKVDDLFAILAGRPSK